MRVRTTDVRAISLENRQSFAGLVSSNLTLSANLKEPWEACLFLALIVTISDVRHPKESVTEDCYWVANCHSLWQVAAA
jgi:hypothetical protein